MNEPTPEALSISNVLKAALVFEGGSLLVAFVGGWLTGVSPVTDFEWSKRAVLLGIAATVPMLLLLAACMLSNSNGIRDIRKTVRDLLGPALDEASWLDILILALLAGVCEEVLFRGFLYPWVRLFNPFFAILLTNLVFAILHAVTPLYAWLAGLTGLYLTACLMLDGTPNLLIPIVAHTVYDWIAFYCVRADYRKLPTDG